MRRLVNTPLDTINLNKKYRQEPAGTFKPCGLWYSIGNDWIGHLSGEMPDRIQPNHFSIEVDDKRLAILDTKEKLLDFSKKYAVKGGWWAKTFQGKKINSAGEIDYIDWERVAQDYAGIEIPIRLSRMIPSKRTQYYKDGSVFAGRSEEGKQTEWAYRFYCASGCIWDLSAVTGFRACNQAELASLEKYRESRQR